jgi:DNA polymerase-3 subunit gamma/tau
MTSGPPGGAQRSPVTHGALALAPTVEEVTPTPAPTSAVAVKRDPPPETEPADALSVFRTILRVVAETRPALASIFEHAAVLELSRERVVLGFESQSFAGAQATEPEALEAITRAVRAHFGAPTHVAIDLSARDKCADTVAQADAAERREALDKARAKAAAHPLVVEAVRLFDAELREVIVADVATK